MRTKSSVGKSGMSTLAAMCAALLSAQGVAMEYHQTEEAVSDLIGAKQFSPYAGRAYPTRVYWGDAPA